ncbi:hypothetical protein GCM10010910_01460 [Microbacterium nanhaiense]|uniref:Ribbon-helix-helix protein CopG domain-containing protein n=1 Tax=Microbacterium nanhaiense TaxID=1301026 RepID=A0ABQ2MXC3_9MICO|nr:hypothetical protein [Microbacterium nanhaiense]GGO59158.1 hypothetical protein GCM10010910_01460 [Microbacterium nanhaiense]
MAETPIRKIRIDDDTWQKLANEAATMREPVSALIRRILITHTEQK